jgi:hypothetical protein
LAYRFTSNHLLATIECLCSTSTNRNARVLAIIPSDEATESLVRVKHKLVVGGLVVAAALALTGSDAVTAPERGFFIPGESLGGVRIGMTKATVASAWGSRHGVCRSCPHEIWYFNYKPFLPEGVGIVFERGRVTHAFTVWQPEGWRTPEGLLVDGPAADIARTYGPLDRRECGRYNALVEAGLEAQTVYYVFENEVWGFGLTVPDASPCL